MNIILKIGVKILQALYLLFKRLPSKQKISFISRQSNMASLDFILLSEKIQQMHPDYEQAMLCRKIEDGFLLKLKYCCHLLVQMYHLATSKIVILDSYSILVSVLSHKSDLLIIQMWHSVGTMKKFGYSILDQKEGSSSKIAYIMRMHANYDYILAASDGYKTHLAEGFNYPLSKIITLPLPRVELLKDETYAKQKKEEIYKFYPQLKHKKTILYVPTFRKSNDSSFQNAIIELADAVNYENYNLIIKAHPLAGFSGEHSQAIIDSHFTSFDMLFACDYIISDYSCIIYEAAILKRPIYLYDYDYREYMGSRDIYMDYKKEMPDTICTTAAETVQAIENNICDPEDIENLLHKYVYTGSQHETQDIVEFIFNHLK